MDINHIQQPLNQFIKRLPKTIKVKQLLVFGSYLEGTATPDSDIDIVVVSDDFESMNEDTRLDMLYKASRDIQPDIELWGFTHQELNKAEKLSLLGSIRDDGFRFL